MMILFDTDLSLGTPGAEIDDGAALILLLRALGDQVKAITTTHGNNELEAVTQNTARMLAMLNRQDIPLGRGAEFPLVEDKEWFIPWLKGYGHTPLWKVPELPRAVDLIIDTIKANPGEVTIIAVGPLTNLALAARLAPEIVPMVKEVITMGGSFEKSGDEPEFNAHCDPEATHIALRAGWPVRTIGLDITHQVPFRREEFAALPLGNPAITLLKSCAPAWIDRVEAQGWGNGDCSLHDALAVAAYMDESLFSWQETGVEVDLALRGVTRFRPVEPGQPSIRVAVAVEVDKVHELIWSYINQV